MRKKESLKVYFFTNEKEGDDLFKGIRGRGFSCGEKLTAAEIEIMKANGCRADSWENIVVKRPFSPSLVRNTGFHGAVRIGKLEKGFSEFDGMKFPLGIYDCEIFSSDLDDYPSVSSSFLDRVFSGRYTVIHNCGEISSSKDYSFFNGRDNLIKLINEKGGRDILFFGGISLADIWFQAFFRDDTLLREKLDGFTEKKIIREKYNFTVIDDYSVVKNVKSIKNSKIGRHAVIDGACRLENVFINSSAEAPVCISDDVIAVDCIVGYGASLESGSYANKTFVGEGTVLKQGVRIIESAAGRNSTIACGEVQNSLLFPLHEQHHNSSFLIASCIRGQSNIAAGSVIGSNHNSRANDGELYAGRGFWSGLCVSLKHNSKFASFTLLAKSDFPYELDIKIPFSLVSSNVSGDFLQIVPAYWWRYNMYALFRNNLKFSKRIGKNDVFTECSFAAPDTAEEIVEALNILRKFKDELPAGYAENSKRKVKIIGFNHGIKAYEKMLLYYCTSSVLNYLKLPSTDADSFIGCGINRERETIWHNAGGLLIPGSSMDELISKIKEGRIISWDEIDDEFLKFASEYPYKKFSHALSLLSGIYGEKIFSHRMLDRIKKDHETLISEIEEQIIKTRKKDFNNPFRKSVYRNQAEMEAVLGSIEDNEDIKEIFASL